MMDSMILTFTLLAVVATAGLWQLNRLAARPGGPRPVALASLPLGLLFLAVPLPQTALATIGAFRAVARTGRSSTTFALGTAHGIAVPFAIGTLGFVTVMAIAVWLDLVGQAGADPDASVDQPPMAWRRWVPLASVLLVLPVGVLVHTMRDVSALLLRTAIPIARSRAILATRSDLGFISQSIATELVAAMIGGFALCGAVALAVAANQVAAQRARSYRTDTAIVCVAGAVLSLWLIWDVVTMFLDLGTYGRAVS